MHQPLEFYEREKKSLEEELEKIKKRLTINSVTRLITFFVTSYVIYSTFTKTNLVFLYSFLGMCFFIFLVVKHTKLQREKDIREAKININTNEIAVLKGDYSNLSFGSEFLDPTHFYSHDIDLFGEGSFFQYLNRTTTQAGRKFLAKTVTENSLTDIKEKQEVLKELSKKVKWRQNFSAISSLIAINTSTTTILNWILGYEKVLPNFLNFCGKFFPYLSIGFIALNALEFIDFWVLLVWFFIGLTITGCYFKSINDLYTNVGKAKEVFKQYHLLLEAIEDESFASSKLQEKQKEIMSEDKKASVIFKQFSKILDAFDQRNNVIIAVLGNGLFLWDIQNAVKTEKWIEKYKNVVEKWFDVVSFFDAKNTLANFVYNHPTYIFPAISKEKNLINAKQLGHPLLNPNKRVDNDFNIDQEQFFIITGANMAGKSTFLRTISLAVVMSNCGLPVCAKEFNYFPVKLITSMRTTDSLTDDESYFYSELKRLKFIIDTIKTEDYFIILDEILKGTNSKDKATGSKQFVEKLNSSASTGIIATHDISLCELSETYNTIENYYFDAEIVNDELYFDYSMKNGVCKNMNASFLLKKMDII